MDLAEKAEQLRGLHEGPDTLVLPNAWDVASARLFAKMGYPAIATTSAGVANSLGLAGPRADSAGRDVRRC